jgi:hypothetical protein
MPKGQRKTRRVNTKNKADTRSKGKKSVLTIPELRKAFAHMDKVVENLRKVAKHSFSDAVVVYREEWRKTFKRDLSPADAASYLKFRYGLKSGKTRRSKTRGGAMPLSGAALDYQMRPGVNGVYGNFPTYQTQGLDRYYASAINSDCGKPNGFPTDGSAASQAGGAATPLLPSLNGLFRPLIPSSPVSSPYAGMMTDPGKGTVPYPSADPVGQPPFRTLGTAYVDPLFAGAHLRTYPGDIYKTVAGPSITGV